MGMPLAVSVLQRGKPLEAKPHASVYRMHRYFARRPDSVFAALIERHSKKGDLVLDPFTGGGVTLVEGAARGRRVVGFDVNPLATFITRMELERIDLERLDVAAKEVLDEFNAVERRYFWTACRGCSASVPARWFEHAPIIRCGCGERPLHDFEKSGIGRWRCTECTQEVKFSPTSTTVYRPASVSYTCECEGAPVVEECTLDDGILAADAAVALRHELESGLWIPSASIPVCNMERESALFKKGFVSFAQFFTERHLLLLGKLREIIQARQQPERDWLMFVFSAMLRYTNKMVTYNAGWRGTEPLEWAKPGYWLPPLHLEARPSVEFERRLLAVKKGKREAMARLPVALQGARTAEDVAAHTAPAYYVGTYSSTAMPLSSGVVDVVITDPPYGSYVHYADLSNFWAVWLKDVQGMGETIDNREEAVVARKKFPGAKTLEDYTALLEKCFAECHRVLKPRGNMVMSFHNREPRAWAALLVAATRAGFALSPEVEFHTGVAMYRHTAQSRRAGSVIGDFILTFVKSHDEEHVPLERTSVEAVFIEAVREVLGEGPRTTDDLMHEVYRRVMPSIGRCVAAAVRTGDAAVTSLLDEFDDVEFFDSHRRTLLEEHFAYSEKTWSLREAT